jgi:NAD-dependent dihydropyrimidine dehydrogenase PreA subunit
MAVKSRFRVIVDPAQCVGCALCQLRCSFRFTKTFRPSEAKISVDWNESSRSYEVALADDCDHCGLCARYCVYGALIVEKAVR